MAPEQEQPVPIIIGGGGQSLPMPPMSDRADLLDKIKPEQMVEVIRQRLLGREFKNGEWVEVPSLKGRKLTEIGAWEIANLMLGVSSVNISISKLNDKEIKDRLLSIARTSQYLLVSNWKEYGITNVSQFYYVHEIIFSNTLAVLKQADGASIQELLKGIVHESRNVQTEAKRESGGTVKRLLGMA